MRRIDDEDPAAIADLQALFPRTGRAYVLGITGSPGAGKSTLTDRVVARFRSEGKSVGVLAVDPTSPFSGGAILGDRIRMQAHSSDPGVFIRSLATRGSLGGLSRATGDCIRVMDAMGKDVVVVETVGVGQDEIDIAQMAHSTLLVTVPGMGDDIQAIKAGILEVADVFIVNKADLDGADRTVRELRQMLELRHALRRPPMEHDRQHRLRARADGTAGRPRSEAAPPANEWEPPILKVIAARDQGVDPVMEAVARHREFLERTGQRAEREAARARMQFLALLRNRLLQSALDRLEAEKGRLDEVALSIARREADPYALAETLAKQLAT
jgi:LAO/AO transport system kinase